MIEAATSPLGSGLPSPADLLALHDQQLRSPAAFLTTPGVLVEELGPLLRVSGSGPGATVLLRAHQAVGEAELSRLIGEQVAHFASQGQPFEWKTFAHDPSLETQLLRLGFRRGEEETVMVGAATAVPPCRLPEGVTVRAARSPSDFELLARQLSEAFGNDHGQKTESTRVAVEANPEAVAVLLAEAGGEVIASARAEFLSGTDFCTLWAGSVSPRWRHLGLYRALVAMRAEMALRRGHSLLEVEALPTSRPILERLGFTAVTTSVPFTWESPG